MGNDNINPLESRSQFDNNNPSINTNKYTDISNNSNISTVLHNPKNIMDFLIKAEGNIFLSNLNKSIAISFNNLNVIKNSPIKKNLLENQLKYINIIDDHIDKNKKGSLDFPYNGTEFMYNSIINNMLKEKNLQKNRIIYPNQVNKYNNNTILPIKDIKENIKQEYSINSDKKEKLNISNFRTTIVSKSGNNNRNNPSKQLKVFKIGKSEDFIIQPNSNDNNLDNQEKIYYNDSQRQYKRSESPSSTQTQTYRESNNNEIIDYKNPLPSDIIIKLNNNNISINPRKDKSISNTQKISSPQNMHLQRPFSPFDYEQMMKEQRNKSPKNNERNKNKLIGKKDEQSIVNNMNKDICNNINKNINNVKVKNKKIIQKDIKNKNNISINSSPKGNKIKKINVKMYPIITKRALRPIPTKAKINIENNSLMTKNNFEINPLSDDESNLNKHKNSNVNQSDLSIRPKYKIKKDINISNNSYIKEIKNKKKNILQISPCKQNNVKITYPNKKEKNIIIENNSGYSKKKIISNIINKSPTTIKRRPIVKKNLILNKPQNTNNKARNANSNININKKIIVLDLNQIKNEDTNEFNYSDKICNTENSSINNRHIDKIVKNNNDIINYKNRFNLKKDNSPINNKANEIGKDKRIKIFPIKENIQIDIEPSKIYKNKKENIKIDKNINNNYSFNNKKFIDINNNNYKNNYLNNNNSKIIINENINQDISKKNHNSNIDKNEDIFNLNMNSNKVITDKNKENIYNINQNNNISNNIFDKQKETNNIIINKNKNYNMINDNTNIDNSNININLINEKNLNNNNKKINNIIDINNNINDDIVNNINDNFNKKYNKEKINKDINLIYNNDIIKNDDSINKQNIINNINTNIDKKEKEEDEIKKTTKKKKKPKKKKFEIDLSEPENIEANNNFNTHSEDISDKNSSDNNIESSNNKINVNKNDMIYCSFGPKQFYDTNKEEQKESQKEDNEDSSINDKLMKELKQKLMERNKKKEQIDNNDSNQKNLNDINYKSNDLNRIINERKNNNNFNEKPNANLYNIFNKIENEKNDDINYNIEEDEDDRQLNDKLNINNINKEKTNINPNNMKESQNDLNDVDYFREFSFKKPDIVHFGENSKNNERNDSRNNSIYQSFGKNLISHKKENEKSEYKNRDSNNEKNNKDFLKFSFKINSEPDDSEFNDINFLE